MLLREASVGVTSTNDVGRDTAIDVLRGLCLTSMTVGHIAISLGGGSAVNTMVHLPLFIDGAQGFVFLSGVSVALADTARRSRRQSTSTRNGWLLGRALFIYLLHVILTIGAIAVFRVVGFPSFVPERSLDMRLLTDVILFRELVGLMDVLALYVVFLVLTPLALLSRARAAQWAVAVTSMAVYLVSQWRPELSSLHAGEDEKVVWIVGAWQLLYFGGLLCGLNWWRFRAGLRSRVGRRFALGAGATVLLGILTLRATFALTEVLVAGTPEWRARLEDELLFDKAFLPPEQLLLVVPFGLSLYVGLSLLESRFSHLFDPFRRMGSRSLRVYLMSCVAVMITATSVGQVGQIGKEVVILLATAAVLLLGLPRTRGKGQPWSI